MSALVIESQLAARIRALAEREGRTVESILETILEQYHPNPTIEEINAHLRVANLGMTPPSGLYTGISLTKAEEDALLQRTSGGDISDAQMVIDERKQGW